MQIIFDPEPRTFREIFSDSDGATFQNEYDIIAYEGGNRQQFYERHLPNADILITQQVITGQHLARAPKLKAIFNVETNFLPNIDYEACFARNIYVLTPNSVFAPPVAEMGIGMAISLLRGIHSEHAAFASGSERYGLSGNHEARLLSESTVGMIGFGNLGRALLPLLSGFRCPVSVYDPWLPDGHLRRSGVAPVSLEQLLTENNVIFALAAITIDNQQLLNRDRLALIPPDGCLIILSRAAIADFAAIEEMARAGRIRCATDVFPDEPLPADSSLRTAPNMLLSSHRAGALEKALTQIGALVLEDLSLIRRNLPPVSCRRAERETVGLLRSKPIEET